MVERFRIDKASLRLTRQELEEVEDGIELLKEAQAEERAFEEAREDFSAKAIFDYIKSLDEKDEDSIGGILENYPARVCDKVFELFLRNDELKRIAFKLDSNIFSKDLERIVFEYIKNEGSEQSFEPVYGFSEQTIFYFFKKINHAGLAKFIGERMDWEDLIVRRGRIPALPNKFFLDKARINEGEGVLQDEFGRKYSNKLFGAIEYFPELASPQAVERIFKSKKSAYLANDLIEKREIFGLSENELIHKFTEHDYGEVLVWALGQFSDESRGNIVDLAIKDGYIGALEVSLNFVPHEKQLEAAGAVIEMMNASNVDNILTQIASWNKLARKKITDALPALLEDQPRLFAREYFHKLPRFLVGEMPEVVIRKVFTETPWELVSFMDVLESKISIKEMIEALLATGRIDVICSYSGRLGQSLDEDFAMKVILYGKSKELMGQLRRFSRLSRSVFLILRKKHRKETAENLDRFHDLTQDDVTDLLPVIPDYRLGTFLENKSLLENLMLDEELAIKILQSRTDRCRGIFENYFANCLHDAFVQEAIRLNQLTLIIRLIDNLPTVLNNRAIARDIFINITERQSYEDFEALLRFNERYSPPLDRIMSVGWEMIGFGFDQEAYAVLKSIYDGTIDAEYASRLGIHKTGEVGINQLRKSFEGFRKSVLDESADTQLIQESSLHREYFKSYVRFNEGEFGGAGEDIFVETIKRHEQLSGSGRLREMPSFYKESGPMAVGKVNIEARESFQYSEQFLSRYNTFLESLEESLELMKEKRPLNKLLNEFEQKREAVVAKLQEKLEVAVHPKAIDDLNKKISGLRDLNLRSIKEIESNFAALAALKDFEGEIRRLIFFKALNARSTERHRAKDVVEHEVPSFEDITWMLSFVDHTVNEETWKKYFKEKSAVRAFKGMINVNALSEEYARAQNQAGKDTMMLDFVPSRGLLMEFSGKMGDACWASKYPSIAFAFPNITSIAMVQNRETKHERVAGSAMMIEAVSASGESLLIIRGLNPIQNVINQLQVEDFLKKFFDYTKGIARDAGRRLAIVIDDHAGGSSTNRPVLFEHLSHLRASLKQVKVVDDETTNFNGYNISDVTYLV